jgi:hypothetical protein
MTAKRVREVMTDVMIRRLESEMGLCRYASPGSTFGLPFGLPPNSHFSLYKIGHMVDISGLAKLSLSKAKKLSA